ncbi:MAG: hypothetical protein WBX14_05960, partial [Candidatus Udaeobacter sp.]
MKRAVSAGYGVIECLGLAPQAEAEVAPSALNSYPSERRTERRQQRFRLKRGIDKFESNRFTRGVLNALQKRAAPRPTAVITIAVAVVIIVLSGSSSFATTKGLSQIVTPDLQPEG